MYYPYVYTQDGGPPALYEAAWPALQSAPYGEKGRRGGGGGGGRQAPKYAKASDVLPLGLQCSPLQWRTAQGVLSLPAAPTTPTPVAAQVLDDVLGLEDSTDEPSSEGAAAAPQHPPRSSLLPPRSAMASSGAGRGQKRRVTFCDDPQGPVVLPTLLVPPLGQVGRSGCAVMTL